MTWVVTMIRRTRADEVDPDAHVYVNRPGRMAYRFAVHCVRQRVSGRQVRIDYGGTHVVVAPDRLVLVDDAAPPQAGNPVQPGDYK